MQQSACTHSHIHIQAAWPGFALKVVAIVQPAIYVSTVIHTSIIILPPYPPIHPQVVLTLLVATTLALFLVWHFRLRLYYVRDRVIEAVVRRWATTKKSTLQDSQEHENRSLGSSAPDSLAPNSSAPGSVVPDSLALDSSAPGSVVPDSLALDGVVPGSSVPLSELSKPAVFHEGSFDTEL